MSKALMTNEKIIELEANKKGFAYDGENIFTFAQWEKRGFGVKNGQKAFIKTRLMSQGENPRSIPVSLYTIEQVKYNEDLWNGRPRKPRQIKDEIGYYLVNKQRTQREVIMV